MKQSGKVALGGILGALALLFMVMTAFPLGIYALPALAGAVLIPVAIEAGVGTGWLVYAAVALLSLLIAPDMEAKVLFVAFFGYYPVLKATIERLRNRVIEWVIKLSVFNVTMVSAYLLLLLVLGLDPEMFEFGGVNLPWVFLAFGNVVFLVYDLALTNVITVYYKVLHPRFARIFHFKQ